MTPASRDLPTPHPRLGVALAILGAVFIASFTLVPAPQEAERVAELSLSCLVCGDLGGTDVALNLLLFAPFAAGLALMGWRTSRVCFVAALVSLSIETVQFAWIPGRDASLSDLVTNTTGATVAAFLISHRVLFLLPTARQARALMIGGIAGWIALQVATAWAVQPSLPATRYWGQWAADLGFLERFTGQVLGATVAGDSLPPHRVTDSEQLRHHLLRDGGPVVASAVTGPAPADLAPIVSVFDQAHVEIVLLGQRGAEAYFRMRTHVDDIRFRPPAISIPNALPVASGVPVRLEGSYSRGVYRLRVESEGRSVERTLAASPNWAWSFFMPFANYALGRAVYGLTALWVAGLLFPLGYWAGRTQAWGPSGILVLAVGLTLIVVPFAGSLPPVHPSEWLAAALGLVSGRLIGTWSLHHAG